MCSVFIVYESVVSLFHLREISQSLDSVCPECGTCVIVFDEKTGERVCQGCGMVLSSVSVDLGPDWRNLDPYARGSRIRAGGPRTLMIEDMGLSTTLGWSNRDAAGNRFDEETKARLYRLRQWQHRSKVAGGYSRNLSKALGLFRVIQSSLSVPKIVVETGSHLYRSALGGNLIRGRAIKNLVAACVYMACRQCRVVRSIDDVAVAADVSRKELTRSYRLLLLKLKADVPKVDPAVYISRISNQLGLFGDVEWLASRLLREAFDLKLTSGRGPASMAAACMYISSRVFGVAVTQEQIAVAAEVTEVTVRNRYKELVRALDIDVFV